MFKILYIRMHIIDSISLGLSWLLSYGSKLDLQLPMQSVFITTDESSNLDQG